jgi:hypothetical protein
LLASDVGRTLRHPSTIILEAIQQLPAAFDACGSDTGSGGGGYTPANAASDEEGGGAAGMFVTKFHAALRGLVDERIKNLEAIESKLTECRLESSAAGSNDIVILDSP